MWKSEVAPTAVTQMPHGGGSEFYNNEDAQLYNRRSHSLSNRHSLQLKLSQYHVNSMNNSLFFFIDE
jgi:hypothetical protein